MRLHPVQGRTKLQLEHEAECILKKFSPDMLNCPIPLDVAKLLDVFLYSEYGWSPDYVEELPSGYLGYCDPKNKTVVIAEKSYQAIINDEGRPRFTGAHEAAHVILHRGEMKSWMVEFNPTTEKLFRKDESEIPVFENPEWQANYLAGALLMPRSHVINFIKIFGKTEYTVNLIAETFKVSSQAARVRMNKI